MSRHALRDAETGQFRQARRPANPRPLHMRGKAHKAITSTVPMFSKPVVRKAKPDTVGAGEQGFDALDRLMQDPPAGRKSKYRWNWGEFPTATMRRT